MTEGCKEPSMRGSTEGRLARQEDRFESSETLPLLFSGDLSFYQIPLCRHRFLLNERPSYYLC